MKTKEKLRAVVIISQEGDTTIQNFPLFRYNPSDLLKMNYVDARHLLARASKGQLKETSVIEVSERETDKTTYISEEPKDEC